MAWTAARQHGAVGHAQLVDAGLSQTEINRHADLLVRGYATLRFTWRQVVDDPGWVTDRLTTVLDDRAAR